MATARVLRLALLILGPSAAQGEVLVTGATGRTGVLLYKALQSSGKLGPVRALVRNATKARELLGCKACNPSEGVFVGDVTDPSSLTPAFEGVQYLAIASAVHGTEPESVVKAVEWMGVRNQVEALLKGSSAGKRIALISTMGTTTPPQNNKFAGNNVFFYKLNAEAYLASTGVPFSIVKPCGLMDEPGEQRDLMVGHDDLEPWFKQGWYMVSRADVAMVTAAALSTPPAAAVRFDMCAKGKGSGPPMPAERLLQDALLPWQKGSRLATISV